MNKINLKIERLVIQERNSYLPQYRRGLKLKLTPENVEKLPDLRGLLDYDTHENEVAEIEGGWDALRCSFWLTASVQSAVGGTLMFDIGGYTSPIVADSADPHAMPGKFYVNSVTVHRKIHTLTALGTRARPTHQSSTVNYQHQGTHHIHSDEFFAAATMAEHKPLQYLMRPVDLFTTMSAMDDIVRKVPEAVRPTVIDTRTILDYRPVPSQRTNVVPLLYLETLFEAYQKAHEFKDEIGSGGETELLDEARGHAQEEGMHHFAFFRALALSEGKEVSSHFTWQELLALDPNVSNVMCYESRSFYGIQTSQTWASNSIQAHIAWKLAMGVPALMAQHGIFNLSFTATNRVSNADRRIDPNNRVLFKTHTVGGLYEDGESFTQRNLEAFDEEFLRTIVREISFDNKLAFDFELHANLAGDTELYLRLDDEPRYQHYVVPTFADSCLSPMVSKHEPSALASDMHELLVRTAQMKMQSQ